MIQQGEVKEIVKRRRACELAIQRAEATRLDYLRYLEFEINLDALRFKRVRRLGLWRDLSLLVV